MASLRRAAASLITGRHLSEICNFFSAAVFYCQRTREKDMNTNLIRAHGTVMDGWPFLLAIALYLLAFGIFAATADLQIAVA